jgi:hypothetical protein
MKTVSRSDIVDAAAHALIAGCCRESYLHDIRGGLQALGSAVELLARAAQNPVPNQALAEKAAALARRALANHETSLLALLSELLPQSEAASTVNVGETLHEVLRFIKGDAGRRSITFTLTSPADVRVLTQARRFRLLMLGMSSTLADGLDPGTAVAVTVSAAASEALIEFRPSLPAPSTPDLEQPLHAWLLEWMRQWPVGCGGRLELDSEQESPPSLRVYLALALA